MRDFNLRIKHLKDLYEFGVLNDGVWAGAARYPHAEQVSHARFAVCRAVCVLFNALAGSSELLSATLHVARQITCGIIPAHSRYGYTSVERTSAHLLEFATQIEYIRLRPTREDVFDDTI